MSERLSSRAGSSIEQERLAYYDDRMKRIRNGETVFVRRNFDSDIGYIEDLVSEHTSIGYIEHDEYGYDVWVYEYDENRVEDVSKLNKNILRTKEEAEELILSYLDHPSRQT